MNHPSTTPNSSLRRLCTGWIPADLSQLACNQDKLEDFKTSVLSLIHKGDLMGIVHNAALQRIGKFAQLKNTDWQATFNINVIAPAVISRLFLSDLQENCGSIVHIGSIHSQLTKPGFTAYATSKAALQASHGRLWSSETQ